MKKKDNRATDFRPGTGPEQPAAMRETGRSGAASRHVSAARRGTRTQRERQGRRDQQRDQERR